MTSSSRCGRDLPSIRSDGMPTPTTLQDGDIVVRAELDGETLVYVLHIPPDLDRSVRIREEAIAQALVCAERQRVRAWLTDAGHDLALLEDFRVPESTHTGGNFR